MQYVVANNKKGVDIAPLIRKIEYVDLSSKESTFNTGTRNRNPTEIAKERYELELKNTFG